MAGIFDRLRARQAPGRTGPIRIGLNGTDFAPGGKFQRGDGCGIAAVCHADQEQVAITAQRRDPPRFQEGRIHRRKRIVTRHGEPVLGIVQDQQGPFSAHRRPA